MPRAQTARLPRAHPRFVLPRTPAPPPRAPAPPRVLGGVRRAVLAVGAAGLVLAGVAVAFVFAFARGRRAPTSRELYVVCDPDCGSVYVDGSRVTPVRGAVAVSRGSHDVVVASPGLPARHKKVTIGDDDSAAAACMPDAPPGALGESSHDIVNGTPSPKFQDSVVFIDDATAQASCSGTIIAPNLVLTARHCVSEIDEEDGCGSITSNSPANGITVQTGASADGSNPDARATKIFYPAGDSDVFCGNDIAIIQVGTPLAPKPRPIRFTPVTVGETGQAVGYGLDENGQDPGGRFQRTGMQVLALGGTTFDFARQDGTTTPVDVPAGMILTSEGACEGDSGGPLFDASGNIVATVTGAGIDEDSCTDMVDLYTALSQHQDAIRQVFQQAGATMSPPSAGGDSVVDAGHHHDGGYNGGDDDGLGSSGSVGVKPGKSGDDDDSDKSSPDSKDPSDKGSGAPKAGSAGCSAAPAGTNDVGIAFGFLGAAGLLARRRRRGQRRR